MKTQNLKMKGDWEEVVDSARITVGKQELGKTPSKEFQQSILIAEHSPIRLISFQWKWPNIKSWIATHWSRHKWECFIKSQRSDRTGINRDDLPQSATVNFIGEANVQHLIDTMRKRLCYQASPETREYAEDLRIAISDINFEIGKVLVPNCVYRCGCPEINGCNFWEKFKKYCKDWYQVDIGNLTIQERYKYYNIYFFNIIEPKLREKGAQ